MQFMLKANFKNSYILRLHLLVRKKSLEKFDENLKISYKTRTCSKQRASFLSCRIHLRRENSVRIIYSNRMCF
ncbi:hypothetical protein BpHYR1_020400 [Brachionus plicatilis]|uniref:Uncharacterized protein n=1 Tax=Brachionus plicatilis TaxID=10195 RepID=A0A3M7R6Z8_BRAPC|nr:hypothetical protein BpHYR1_020400 [Brachionus plicatilis]